MKLLPFENIKIDSPLSQIEIESTIKNNIAWNTELGMTFTKNSLQDYEGFVENKTFKVRRILKRGINSFIPIVSGIIYEKSKGCQIELRLRLHRIVILFAIAFTIFLGSSFFMQLLSKPLEMDWVGLLLFIAPYIMCNVFFNYEAKIVKNKLKLILKSENNDS